VGDKGVVRVVVVQAFDFLGHGTVAMLDRKPDVEVVGRARNGAGALSEAQRTLPDIVLLEVPTAPYLPPRHYHDQRAEVEFPRRWWIDKFTDSARRVVWLAQESARHLDHSSIGTEHILPGLIREDEGVAAGALESLDISLLKVRERIEGIRGGDHSPSASRLSFTARARNVLGRARDEAGELGQDDIDTEHILLGLVLEGGTASQILHELGADFGRVHREVIELLAGVSGGPKNTAGSRSSVESRTHCPAWQSLPGFPASMTRTLRQWPSELGLQTKSP
jgi:hypothetical protein